ncbi:MAG: sigma-54 dependent transcriptional regulator [Vicinamibacterales bacterium]
MGLGSLVGRAPAFLNMVARIPTVARTGHSVLITGETGTGKELCARAIHHLGPRARHPFIPIDCGALPDQLFENEVFGHARGAFTDARAEQRGLLAIADGGTVFLDEVDALSSSAQAKLLRFLQERTFKPLGAERFVRADVNVLSATNQDLAALVRQGRFRADLFYRLCVLALHLVPLRKRPGDVSLLARHFVRAGCDEQQLPQKTLSPLAAEALEAYDWPGNVRELWNVVRRAVTFAEGDTILRAHVQLDAGSHPDAPEPANLSFRNARQLAVSSFERRFVEELLVRHGGNVTHAAKEAKKDRRAFGRLVKKYDICRRVS